MTKRRAVLLTSAAAAAAALALAAGRGEQTATARVERGDLVIAAEVTGTLTAATSDQLGPPQAPGIFQFKIARLAPEGQVVRRSDPVLAFDTSELERELAAKSAEAAQAAQELEKRRAELAAERADRELELAEAEADLAKARLTAEQPPELVAEVDARTAELDLRLKALEVERLAEQIDGASRAGEAELAALADKGRRAAARVAELEHAIARMTVAAPRDGTVVHVADRRGEKKTVGDTCWRHDKVVEVPDLTRLEAEGEVEEVEAGRVAPGQPVRLVLDAHPDGAYRARVEHVGRGVAPRSWRDPARVVRLRLVLEEVDSARMRPGMRFRGEVEVGRHSGVLLVPLAAVRSGQGGPTARRETLWGWQQRAIELGASDGERIEVLRGLAEGDRVETLG